MWGVSYASWEGVGAWVGGGGQRVPRDGGTVGEGFERKVGEDLNGLCLLRSEGGSPVVIFGPR